MKTTKQKTILGFITLLGASVVLQSCKPENPTPDENEVITTLSVIATNGSNTEMFTFRDLDGASANLPVQFDTIRLTANKTYNVKLLLLDETKNPTDTLSNEIAEEADEHIFFFTSTPNALATVTITDYDSQNLPIGLLSTWHTGDVGTGTVKITLRHQPGVKDGTYEPGDTDVEVAFPVIIQ